MPILILQHAAIEGPGRLGLTLRDHGKQLDVRRLDLWHSAHRDQQQHASSGHGGSSGVHSNGTRHEQGSSVAGKAGRPAVPAGELRGIPDDFDDVEGVVVLGGPMNVSDDPATVPWMAREIEFLAEAHKRNLPLVGICLGAQLIAKALGGEVGPMAGNDGGPTAEWGMSPVRQFPPANTDIILAGIPWAMQQFHAHGQEVTKLPVGALALQFSDKCKVQSFRAGLRTYGFQYHFECDMAMIRTFLSSGDPQIAQAGVDPQHAMDEAGVVYEEFARLSDRICVNLASYLFPVGRAISA